MDMNLFLRIFSLFVLVLSPHFVVSAESALSGEVGTGTTGIDQRKKQNFTIGAVLSLSGVAAPHGTAIKDGLEFARAKLAEEGIKVTIVYEDDGSVAQKTTSSVEKLARDGIKYVVGPTWGILALPAAPSFQRHKMLSFQPANSSEFVSGNYPQFFFLLSPPSTAMEPLRQFLSKFKGKKAAIVVVESIWGRLWQTIFLEAANAQGVQVVINEVPQFSDIQGSLKPLVSRMKREGVNLLLSTTWSEGTAQTVKELEQQHLALSLLSPDLNEAVNDELVDTQSSMIDGYTIIPKEDSEFIIDFLKVYKRKPRKYTDTGYDALMTMVAAIKESGSNTEIARSFLENSFEQKGVSGRLKFNSSHDVAGAGYDVRQIVERMNVASAVTVRDR
jgi:ABC-type branched-subunit amino acid transport system substrate-binding protein